MIRLSRAPEVLFRNVVDRVVLLGPRSRVPVVLSPTGAAVWRELESPTNRDALVDALAERFDSDPAAILRDVIPFLQELSESGAVVVS